MDLALPRRRAPERAARQPAVGRADDLRRGNDLLRQPGAVPSPGNRTLAVRRRGARHRGRVRDLLPRNHLPSAGRHRRHPGTRRRCGRRARRRARGRLCDGRDADRARLRRHRPRVRRCRHAAARDPGALHPLSGDGRLPGLGRIPHGRRRGADGDRSDRPHRPGPAGGGLALGTGARPRHRDAVGGAPVGSGAGAARDGGGGLRGLLRLAAAVRRQHRRGGPARPAPRAVRGRPGLPRGVPAEPAGGGRLRGAADRDPGARDAGRARVRRSDAQRLGDRARHGSPSGPEPRPARGRRRQPARRPRRRGDRLPRARLHAARAPADRRRTRGGSGWASG